MAFPRGKDCPQDLHRCDNGECILKVDLCDGVRQCRNGSDEYHCNYTQCSSSQFHCTNGPRPCISISYTCDFKRNCRDNSDEQYCQIPQSCAKNEFRCRNGQCIPIGQNCDLVQQCVDGSDELQCEKCNTDVAMQCADGSCLSKRRQCDGVVDCPGPYKDDELQCAQTAYHSCLDWRRKGYIKSGRYSINPNGLGLTQVECDMDKMSNKVATILHHNAENRIRVESQPEYLKQLIYFVTDAHIRAIKNMSSSCEQFLSVECYNSKALHKFWYSIDKERVPFEHPSYGDNCSCLLSKACQEGRKSCHCTTDSMWNLEDAGYIYMKDKLPMTAIEIYDTDDTLEVAHFFVGPLICYQDLDETFKTMKCKNLQFSDTKWKCVLDRDQYGIAVGCRDASNLKQCDFLCWMPINIMGVLALSGMTLPGEIYAWTVVFILPVNSALNPILYTISSMGRGPKKEKSSNLDGGRPTTTSVMKMIGDDKVHEKPLESFFAVGTYIGLVDVYQVVRQVTTIIQNAESKYLHIGKIELDDVFIKEFAGGFTAVLHAPPILMDGNPQEMYDDMEHLGKFVGHLLRLYTHRIKAFETTQ